MKKIYKQIDQYMLINHPHLWTTQLHTFIFAYMFIMAATLLIAFTFPVSTANVPDVEEHFIYPTILSGVAYLIWVYRVSLFKVNLQFGYTNAFAAFKTQMVYLLIITLLAAIPFIYVNVLSDRVKHLVNEKEFLIDLENLDSGPFIFHLPSSQLTPFYEHKVKKVRSEVRIEDITTFIQTANKYGGFRGVKAERLMELEDVQLQFGPQKNIVQSNIRRIYIVYIKELFFQDKMLYWSNYVFEDLPFYWFGLLSIFSLFYITSIFLITSLRIFVLSVLTTIFSFFGWGLFSNFYYEQYHDRNILFLSIATFFSLILYGKYGNKNNLGLIVIKIAISVSITLIPLCIWDFIDSSRIMLMAQIYEGNPSYLLKKIIVIGIVFTWFLWNILYYPTLKKLQTIPST